ncbi:hypothetical protein [Candidatus Epulonipiscium viviparus]|uniref:hypothetical protein n=1 Tax=Candidatus Epulonipiscium viviparus TaxID=420336 RepID=UPI00016C073F|nr:hypothetical protein [Candidatus Epulopiscium viviparus]
MKKSNVSLIATVYLIASVVTAQTVTYINNKFDDNSYIEQQIAESQPISSLSIEETSP